MAAKNIMLLCCGSFNPITHMHLRLFELARDTLQNTGKFIVVAGYISPTHDGYKKKGLVASKHRVEMCRLGTQTSDWIRTSSWESEQSSWLETLQVVKHFQDTASSGTEECSHLPADVRVKLLCGADFMESFAVPGLWKDEDIENIVGNYGLVVITRKESNPEDFIKKGDVLTRYQKNINIVDEWIPNEISATKIRLALSRNESIKYLVPEPVIDYIKKHGLYRS